MNGFIVGFFSGYIVCGAVAVYLVHKDETKGA